MNFTPKEINYTQVLGNRGLILSRERCVKSERMTSTLITWQEYFCCVLVAIGVVTEDGGK